LNPTYADAMDGHGDHGLFHNVGYGSSWRGMLYRLMGELDITCLPASVGLDVHTMRMHSVHVRLFALSTPFSRVVTACESRKN